MSKLPKKSRDRSCKAIGDHEKYISRITKTLYYGKFPRTDGLSLPVTELAAELFSEAQRGRSLDRLHCDDAAKISRNACVSPCSLVLAILYLERLKKVNPEYLERTSPSDLFLVSLMVSCKFLYDEGESDEVFIDEWASSGGLSNKQMAHIEKDFLNAIGWEIYVSDLTFWKKLNEIEVALARKQGNQRGFFTYTEIHNLLTTVDLHNFVQCVAAVSVILVASYTAALLTLVGSVMIVTHIPGTCMQPKKADNQHENSTLLPMIHEPLADNLYLNDDSILTQIDEIKTDMNMNSKSEIKALNVLKTGIFLASIESFLKPFCNKIKSNNNETQDPVVCNSDNESVTWDWWNVPSMKWLSDTSDIVENFKFNLPKLDFTYFGYFMDTYISKVKHLQLEDHIHKATKTRIQDQLETNWHKEWTDTINNGWHEGYFLYYLQDLKS